MRRGEEMRRANLSVLPEEPLKNACVARMSVADNIAFREFDRAPYALGGWWLNRAKFSEDAKRKIARYRIKTRSRRHRRSANSPAATCSAPCWRASLPATSTC